MSSVRGPCCREKRLYFRLTIFQVSLFPPNNNTNKTDIWNMWKFLKRKPSRLKRVTKNSIFNVRYYYHKLTVTKPNRQKLFPLIINHICIQNEAKLNKKYNFVGRFSIWISIIVIVIVIFHLKFLFSLSSIFGFVQAVSCFFNFISLLKVLFCFEFFSLK